MQLVGSQWLDRYNASIAKNIRAEPWIKRRNNFWHPIAINIKPDQVTNRSSPKWCKNLDKEKEKSWKPAEFYNGFLVGPEKEEWHDTTRRFYRKKEKLIQVPNSLTET